MKRLIPLAMLVALGITTVRVPAATGATLGQIDSDELETSYTRLMTEFYKHVDPQVTLDGARTGMQAYLESKGITHPVIPALHATSDDATNIHAIDREVANVDTMYGTRVGSRNLTYAAVAGMLDSVRDKYTTFLSPRQYADLNAGLDGKDFGGVGLGYQIDETSKLIRVDNVIPDGPAEKAGIVTDDLISAIDNKTTKGLTTEQIQKLLRGTPGTQVSVTVIRDSKLLAAPVMITRATIHPPSVYAKLLPGDIGYAALTVFGLTTASELSAALTKLQAEGAKAYVLDLRNNGGGYLNAAIDVSSKFIPSGPIVSVQSRAGSDTEFDAENTAITPKPLIVLVNKYTASASEITAGAIQDSGVGELLGEKTYGKGVVQTIFPLPDKSAIKITTARYLTPHGRDINTVGIEPDIVDTEPRGSRFGDPAHDPQLERGITYLQGRIAQLSAM